MPPINQQGSRAGLITALVVFAILFVVSSVFAIQFYGKWQQEHQNYATYQTTYKDILPAGAVTSTPVTDLLNVRNDATNKFGVTQSDSALEIAIKERDALAELIVGSKLVPGTTQTRAEAAYTDALDVLKKHNVSSVSLQPGSVVKAGGLVKVIGAVATAAGSSQDTIADLNTQLNARKADILKGQSELAAVNETHAKELQKAQGDDAVALANVQKANTDKDTTIQQVKDAQKAVNDATAVDVQKNLDDTAALNKKIKDLNGEIDVFRNRMARNRGDVTSPIVRQSDGKIVRIPNTEVCYINVGTGDQVTPGLTFEVYDKNSGVPGIPEGATGDEQLPVGKGSIEITHVGATSSECRIVRITPGMIITEGDVISNLVYDPHTKYTFFVYGNFDLAGNGRANSADAEVMKRLVTQWGGKLGDAVTVDTDFVILGAEPVLPTFNKDELNAENQAILDRKQKEIDQYLDIVQKAKELHIPIMNQNRFLYYVGFYDQARR